MNEGAVIQYRIVYWRDIPVSIRLRHGKKRLTYALPEIFQKTVYRAAYRGKAITGEAFQASWHATEWLTFEAGSGEEIELMAMGNGVAEGLIQSYDEARLNTLALNRGYEPGIGI